LKTASALQAVKYLAWNPPLWNGMPAINSQFVNGRPVYLSLILRGTFEMADCGSDFGCRGEFFKKRVGYRCADTVAIAEGSSNWIAWPSRSRTI